MAGFFGWMHEVK